MANIINQILEIDKLAVQKLDEANKHKSDILLEIESTKLKNNETLQAEASSRIAKTREVEEAYAKLKIEKIKENNDNAINALEENYKNNHQKWEEEIIKNIIG